jgi:hypothetical protein
MDRGEGLGFTMKERDSEKPKALTTRQILLKYAVKDAKGNVDASGMLSKECYNEWVQTRSTAPRVPHTAFRDAVKKVLIGSSRVTPFPPEVEAAVLVILREKVVWPCFADIPRIGIGKRGWHVRGYHQRKLMGDSSDTNDSEEDKEEDEAFSSSELATGPEVKPEPGQHAQLAFKSYGSNESFLTPELFSMIVRTNNSSEAKKLKPQLIRKKMSSCEILRDAKIESQALSKMSRYDSRSDKKERIKRNDSHNSVSSQSILLSLLPQTDESDLHEEQSHHTPSHQQQSTGIDVFDTCNPAPSHLKQTGQTQHPQSFDSAFTDALSWPDSKSPSLGQSKTGKSFSTGVFSKAEGRLRGNTDFGAWGVNHARQQAEYRQNHGRELFARNTIFPTGTAEDLSDHHAANELRRNSFPTTSKGSPVWNSLKHNDPPSQQKYCADWMEQHCTI